MDIEYDIYSNEEIDLNYTQYIIIYLHSINTFNIDQHIGIIFFRIDQWSISYYSSRTVIIQID